MLQAQPLQAVEDLLHRILRGAGHVGVFDAQHELPAVLSFDVKGGREQAFSVIDATRLCSIAANFGDVRSIITHPASTTHGRLTEPQRQAAGITQAMIRLGVGLEDVADLKADLARGLDALA
ncbi:MAG: PLP-dependent transferase [Rubrivivax sp.]